MKKAINGVHLEGYVYDFDIKEAVTGANSKAPGTHYLKGTLQICTDETGANVCPVYIPYAAPLTSTGRQNETYTIMKKLLDGEFTTWVKGGKDSACRVRIDTNIACNDFYAQDGSLVSQIRNEGGFLHVMTDELNEDIKARSFFQADVIITSVIEKEADPEREVPAHALIKGYSFAYNGDMFPLEYMVVKPEGVKFFLKLDPSEAKPYFTKVTGHQTSRTTQVKFEEESAFGEPIVRFRSVSRKAYVVESASKYPYAWDDAESITVAEFKEKLQNRDVKLAALKKNTEEYRKNRGAGGANTASAASSDNYDF